MECGNDRLLDFRAAVTSGCLGQCSKIEFSRGSIAFLQMNREYFPSYFLVGQVDEKYLVKSAFAQKFWR